MKPGALVLAISLAGFPAIAQDTGVVNPEFEVRFPSENVVGFQVARNAAGEVVVVWREDDQMSLHGTFARRFSPSGLARGGNIRVKGGTAFEADVGVDAAGNFLVTWVDLFGREIAGKLFDASGAVVRERVLITADDPRDNLLAPAVAMDGAGNFLLTWWYQGRIRARAFDPQGEPRGDELDLGTGLPLGAAVASNAAGDAVVVWQRGANVVARRLDTGGALRGDELRLNADPLQGTTVATSIRPDVGVDSAGGFVAVWRRGRPNDRLLVRRFDAAGTPVSDEVRVREQQFSISARLDVAVAPDGEALVSWTEEQRPAGGHTVRFPRGRFFRGSELSGGGPFQLSRLARQRTPIAASDGEGGFVVVFETGQGLFGRLLPPDARGGILQLVDVDPAFSEAVEDDVVLPVGVLRTAGLEGRVVVIYRTAPTGERPATAGEDYVPTSGTVALEEGESFATFPLEIKDDDLAEPRETLALEVSLFVLPGPAGGAATQTPEVTVTLIDDEPSRPGDPPARLGGEVRLPEPGETLERRLRLAAGTSGDTLAVWLAAPSAEGPWSLKGRLTGPGLEPRGPEVTLAAEAFLDTPTVTARPDGSFFVTWVADGGVFGRRVTAEDGALRVDPRVHLVECVDQPRIHDCIALEGYDVAADGAGRFVVSWGLAGYQTYYSGGFPFHDAFRRRFDPDGEPLEPRQELVGESPTAVASAPSGEFLVVWRQQSGLVGQRFDAAGAETGDRLGIEDRGPGDFRPAAAPRPDGGWVVVWQDGEPPAGLDVDGLVGRPAASDVFGRRIGAGGEVGELFQVNLFTPGEQLEPRVAAGPGGDFVVVWTSEGELGPERRDVFAQRFAADGRPAGKRFAVASTPGLQSSPAVTTDAVGDFVVTWESEGTDGDVDVFAQRFSATSCIARPDRLCLGRGRFALEVDWRAADGRTGRGRAIRLTEDTGSFWFFNEENVELIVKVLDGRTINGHFWVFYGALSNVEFTLQVTDTETGATKSYMNRQGSFASVGDVTALPGGSP